MHRVWFALVLLAMAAAISPVPGAGDKPTSGTLTRADIADEAIKILEKSELPAPDRIAMIESLLRQHPDVAEAWAALGELRMDAGQDDKAMPAFERAVAKDPTLYSAWHMLGILRKREGKDLEGALAALRKALELGAPKARELNEIAVTLAYLDRADEALAAWRQAIAADPDWGVLYANAIRVLAGEDRLDEAKDLFERSLAAKRFEENAVLWYGEALVGQKKFGRAAEAYAMASKAHPDNARIRYYYGCALNDDGEAESAVEQLVKARELAGAGEDGAAMRRAASQTLFSIQHRKDWEKFQEARELVFSAGKDPDDLREDLNDAIGILSPLVERHPDFWNARFIRGVANRRLDRRPEARADFEAVFKLFPDEPNTVAQFGLLQRDEGDKAGAARTMRRAVELAPKDPTVMINAGFVLIDAGLCAEAKKMYERFRRLVPESKVPRDQDPGVPLREEIETRCK